MFVPIFSLFCDQLLALFNGPAAQIPHEKGETPSSISHLQGIGFLGAFCTGRDETLMLFTARSDTEPVPLVVCLLSWAFPEMKIASCCISMPGHLWSESLVDCGGVCKDFQAFSFLLLFPESAQSVAWLLELFVRKKGLRSS